MEDILGSFKRNTVAVPAPQPQVEVEIAGSDDNMSVKKGQFMATFFGKVTSIREELGEIRTKLDQFEKLTNLISNSPDPADLKKQVVTLISDTDVRTKRIGQQLKDLETENKAFISEETSRIGSSEARIRANMLSTLAKKFTDLMAEFQDKQNEYRDSCRESIVRQYKIINPSATEEEVTQIRTGQVDDAEIFKARILQREQYVIARNTLADIQQRHMDILKLTQSIRELHQLFVDMAMLVESQGELIHQIEYNVAQASEYVGEGQAQLERAVELQSSARKKTCCILIIVLIVLGVILGPVLGTQLSGA